MKMNTTIAEPAMAIRPLRIESAPSDGPTVRSSRMTTGAGKAPARSTMARSRASSTVNWPVITARPRLVDRRPLVEELEFEQRGLADERLGAPRVLHARQLDQDLIRALPRDRGLAHAELIDAVANRLEPLTDGVVAQLADPAIVHHEAEPTRH